jgi:hypothetical protein
MGRVYPWKIYVVSYVVFLNKFFKIYPLPAPPPLFIG